MECSTGRHTYTYVYVCMCMCVYLPVYLSTPPSISGGFLVPVMSLAKMTLHSRPLCFERALATW